MFIYHPKYFHPIPFVGIFPHHDHYLLIDDFMIPNIPQIYDAPMDTYTVHTVVSCGGTVLLLPPCLCPSYSCALTAMWRTLHPFCSPVSVRDTMVRKCTILPLNNMRDVRRLPDVTSFSSQMIWTAWETWTSIGEPKASVVTRNGRASVIRCIRWTVRDVPVLYIT